MKLAITGEMASGKTNIAKYLVEKYNFSKFSFADDLKLYATEIFDINMNVKDRKLLQQFGTKMKEIDENIWIKRLDNKIKDISDNIIIDDLRYPNEELYLKSKGFKILKLDTAYRLHIIINYLKTRINKNIFFLKLIIK
jgi:adenylate kinase family enzyme